MCKWISAIRDAYIARAAPDEFQFGRLTCAKANDCFDSSEDESNDDGEIEKSVSVVSDFEKDDFGSDENSVGEDIEDMDNI